MIYAENGINWRFMYEVVYEDECILILKDLGRFHKFDDDRKFQKPIDKYIDIINGSVYIDSVKKLVEVQ